MDPDEQVGHLLRLESHRYEEGQRGGLENPVGLLSGRLSITVE